MRALSRIMAATIVSVATAAGRLPAAGSDDRLAAPPTAGAEPSADDIARLITALGDADYAVRETAAARLSALGPPAADALLTAAETTTDLEVALRARWLAESIAAGSPDDPPEVAAELTRFARADFDTRVRIMHRLLRLDDDAGIEPLARIVRLERSLAGSRVAAALLAREWRPGEESWPAVRQRIAAGLKGSQRPAARFLRAVVAATAADDPQAAARGADEAAAALAALERGRGAGDPPHESIDMDDSSGDETTLRIFRRCVIDLFLAAGRREAALAEARRMLEDGWKREEETEAADITPANLIWAVEHGLPEAVDILQGRWPGLKIDRPLTAYAAAVALRARAEPARAAQLADSASAALGEAGGGSTERLRAALLLAKWGATEWATREYRAVVDDPATPAGEFALAGILFSEFLHDHARDDEAAEALRTVVDGRGENAAGDAEQTLRRLERDPKSVRSRLAYFQSCAAAARGDAAGRRRAIDASLRQDGKDVESLIALYQLPDNTPAQQADARARVAQALEQIDDEIGALPGEANGYNEYAWLVANTEGDVRKAIRYSKQSLELSFDNSSYLDTLAHCHAAAGDRAAAIRAQSLAHRLEPHNRTIRRNLDLFRAQAGER